jgi:pilus assembly protein CpaF
MLGRFSIRTVEAPEPLPEVEAPPLHEAPRAVEIMAPPAPEPAAAAPSQNALLAEKLLDAKVRLHRKLLEDINLSALEKLPEETLRSTRRS